MIYDIQKNSASLAFCNVTDAALGIFIKINSSTQLAVLIWASYKSSGISCFFMAKNFTQYFSKHNSSFFRKIISRKKEWCQGISV